MNKESKEKGNPEAKESKEKGNPEAKKSKENQVAKESTEEEGCDVACELPPGPGNPLPEYGELAKKRELKKATAPTREMVREENLRKKRAECREEPLKDKCVPKELLLPSKSPPETVGRILETDGPAGRGDLVMKGTRVKKTPVTSPEWLVELSNDQLQSALDAKTLLSTGNLLCDLLEPFLQAIQGLGATITEEDVREIMRRVPITSKGWSFSHFMFIAANPSFARKKGVLQDPLPSEAMECEEEKEAAPPAYNKDIVERLYQVPKTTRSDKWPPREGKKNGEGSQYSEREKIFYSALLYCEMYETMEEVQRMYKQGVSIPESRDKALKRQQERGFGVSNIGTAKLGFAEWDKPPPPLPKISPYLADLALVAKRRQIILPNGELVMYKRSMITMQPLFLAVRAPEKPKDTIKVMEDGRRLKSILEVLGSQGNCLAMLPDVHKILHLSDTLLEKLEEIRRQKGPGLQPRVPLAVEMDWINKEAKNLFRPHGLPVQIAKIPDRISFSDAIKLRQICQKIRDQHWDYICSRKLQFREKVWKLMHVDRIPCGNLRESFVYAFQAFLPVKSNFPIVHDDANPW